MTTRKAGNDHQGSADSTTATAATTASSPQTTSTMTTAKIVGPDLPPIPATAKRMFLVRHGEVNNPGGARSVYYGSMDVPLSKLGEEEAAVAAAYLAEFPLSQVFASPLARAVYGAERVRELQQQQEQSSSSTSFVPVQSITIHAGFTELDRGDWCGKTKEEIGAENLARFDACDETVTPRNGESYPALKRRVLAALAGALERVPPGSAAALVSHLQVTRCIVSDALSIPIDQMTDLKVATASVTCIDYYHNSARDDQGGDDSVPAPPPQPTVHFQSFKPEAGLAPARDGAN
jgi:broad specificity phosphatase PhoE